VNWTDLHNIPQSTWSTYNKAATPAKNKATEAQAIATSVRLATSSVVALVSVGLWVSVR
jgi:hypothetical protein